MPVSYKKAIAWGKRKFAEGYASGRRNRIQWSDLTANVAEIDNFDRCKMQLSQGAVQVYGTVAVFYVPCGECGNPMFVKEAFNTSVVLACSSCGHESETDRLPLTEALYINIDANEFNLLGDNDDELS